MAPQKIMPRIPAPLWARFIARRKPGICLVTVHLTNGEYVDDVVVDENGTVAGGRVGGHTGVDPDLIDFTTGQVDGIATRQGLLATFGIRRWYWLRQVMISI